MYDIKGLYNRNLTGVTQKKSCLSNFGQKGLKWPNKFLLKLSQYCVITLFGPLMNEWKGTYKMTPGRVSIRSLLQYHWIAWIFLKFSEKFKVTLTYSITFSDFWKNIFSGGFWAKMNKKIDFSIYFFYNFWKYAYFVGVLGKFLLVKMGQNWHCSWTYIFNFFFIKNLFFKFLNWKYVHPYHVSCWGTLDTFTF